MPTKKRFFTRNKEKVYKSPQDRTSIGNKSGKARESIRLVKLAQDKKKASPSKPLLPNISQNINEPLNKFSARISPLRITWKQGMLWLFLLIIASLSFWQGIIFTQKLIVLQSIFSQRMKLSEDLALWQGIAQKYPTYRDAYFQAAVLAYRLGDFQKEQEFLEKTLQLDPNYLPAQGLEKISR